CEAIACGGRRRPRAALPGRGGLRGAAWSARLGRFAAERSAAEEPAVERRVAPALVALVLALAAALAPAGAPDAHPAAPADDGALFFSMSIADEHGAVLAE